MADETSGLSRSVEDYLKVIYSICMTGETASTSAIAEALVVQPASVTGMVKRLAEAAYLEHVPYRGVRLTEVGTREALRVLRRHRILETYLTERLGYPWEDVHPEAERLEHAASDQLIERMAAALKNPSYDPHGAPIPTPAGEIESTDSRTLAELATGEEAIVRAVRDDDSEGLLAVQAAGLLPGTRVRVTGRTTNPPELELEVEGPAVGGSPVEGSPVEGSTAEGSPVEGGSAEGPTKETHRVLLRLAERVFVVPAPPHSKDRGDPGERS